jgi:hypothetical protein
VLACCLAGAPAPLRGEVAAAAADLELFVREGCPHCRRAEVFVAELQRAHPELRIATFDVGVDAASLDRLRDLAEEHHVQAIGVPAFHARGRLLVGFADAETTGQEIRRLLELAAAPEPAGIDTPGFGRLYAHELGLPLFTLAIGLIDGTNPCAMWVLLFLLSMLAHLRSRRRMAALAATFVLASGAVYFAFMAAWLNLLLWVGFSRPLQIALGVIALAIGALDAKDFVAPGFGPSLRIPESARPGIAARLRGILRADRLGAAWLAIVALAIAVNAVELLCTAGLPTLYTQILTLQALPRGQYYAYLGLYNLAYVFDDALMVALAVATLGHRKLQEHEGRWLKLASGAVLLGLGAVLLLRPDWLAAG